MLIATLNANNLESFDISVEVGLQQGLMGWNSFLSLFSRSFFHFFLNKTHRNLVSTGNYLTRYITVSKIGVEKKEVKADSWLPSLAENKLKKRKEGWPQSSRTSIFTAQKATRDCVAPSSFVCSSRQMRIQTFQGYYTVPLGPCSLSLLQRPFAFHFRNFYLCLSHTFLGDRDWKKKQKTKQQLKIARCNDHKRSGGDLPMKHVIKLSNTKINAAATYGR